MHDKWETTDHTRGRNQGSDQKTSGKGEGVKGKVFGREMRKKIMLKLYIETWIPMDWGAIKSCRGAVENLWKRCRDKF